MPGIDPIPFFSKESLTTGKIDVGGAQKAHDTAVAEGIMAEKDGTFTAAHGKAILDSNDSLNLEKNRTGAVKHYNELTGAGVAKPIAAARAGAHGINQATRRAALLAHANPAIATTLALGGTALGGTALYEGGKKEQRNDTNEGIAKRYGQQA